MGEHDLVEPSPRLQEALHGGLVARFDDLVVRRIDQSGQRCDIESILEDRAGGQHALGWFGQSIDSLADCLPQCKRDTGVV